MYRIIISPRAKKELKKIAKIYRRAMAEAVEEIGENPFIGKALTWELTGRHSYRIGVYRIIYKIEKTDKKVYLITAGHRGAVYK